MTKTFTSLFMCIYRGEYFHQINLYFDITFRRYGYPNQTDEPIMAHPPDVDSDLTLDQWIEQIMARDDKVSVHSGLK